ncbi:MAG: hypothetical protein RIK87_24440 [Fuerstiella sp.]
MITPEEIKAKADRLYPRYSENCAQNNVRLEQEGMPQAVVSTRCLEAGGTTD